MDQILLNTSCSGYKFLDIIFIQSCNSILVMNIDGFMSKNVEWVKNKYLERYNLYSLSNSKLIFTINNLILSDQGKIWALEGPVLFIYDTDNWISEDKRWGNLNYRFKPIGYTMDYVDQRFSQLEQEIENLKYAPHLPGATSYLVTKSHFEEIQSSPNYKN